ncbi:MAG: hypothetical protein ACREI2_12745 [Nitrospiraceae bacterium]
MKTSLVLGGLLGGMALFVWGSISWMVLPWHMMTFEKFKDEATIAQALTANALRPGLYLLPNVHKHDPGVTEEQKKAEEAGGMKRMVQGPFMFASVSLAGAGNMGHPLLITLLSNILSALLATWMLLKTNGLRYLGRVGFVMLIALTAAIVAYLPDWTWWHFSTSFTAVGVADLLIGWFLAGLVIAKLTPATPGP